MQWTNFCGCCEAGWPVTPSQLHFLRNYLPDAQRSWISDRKDIQTCKLIMLRLCPSEICLTRDDIERVTQRMATRKEAGPSRTPAPLRRSIQHQNQRATVRPGPGRSRDDAVVHEYPGLAMRPHLQAEYVSTRHNSSHITASTRIREVNGHTDFVDSTSESESDLSSLSSSPPDGSLNQLNGSAGIGINSCTFLH